MVYVKILKNGNRARQGASGVSEFGARNALQGGGKGRVVHLEVSRFSSGSSVVGSHVGF